MTKVTVLSADKTQQVAFSVDTTENPAVFKLLNDKGEPEARVFNWKDGGTIKFHASNLLVIEENEVYGASLRPTDDRLHLGSLVSVSPT